MLRLTNKHEWNEIWNNYYFLTGLWHKWTTIKCKEWGRGAAANVILQDLITLIPREYLENHANRFNLLVYIRLNLMVYIRYKVND